MSRAALRVPPLSVGVLAAVLAAGACSGSPHQSGPSPVGTPPSPSQRPSAALTRIPAQVLEPRFADTLARHLSVPWGLAFLPDGSALVSERDTHLLKRVTPAGQVSVVGPVDGVDGGGEGGLLGIVLSPTYGSDHLLYAYYTHGDSNRVVRMTYDRSGLGPQQTILDGIPSGAIHNGGRLAFGPDGDLYVSTGEAGRGGPAQDTTDLGGKILRITPEGRPAPGNPFAHSPVYSYGHRNVQGLTWDPSGQLWASEFGQNTWDELNRVEAGGNYGWPVVEGHSSDARFVDPVRVWHTDVASPSGIAYAGGALYLAALRGARLWQVPIPGGRVGRPRALLTGELGRLRTVALAPDGSLWVMTSNRDGRGAPHPGDDRIVRLPLQ
jgi:glucose/arabinose dehydrogenase